MNKIKVGVCFALCSLAVPSMAQYMWQESNGAGEDKSWGRHTIWC